MALARPEPSGSGIAALRAIGQKGNPGEHRHRPSAGDPSDMKRRTRIRVARGLLLAAASVATVAVLVGATVRPTSHAPWRLIQANDDGRFLVIQHPLAGCWSFDRVRVQESSQQVFVEVLVSTNLWDRVRGTSECPAVIRFPERSVALREPLGQRRLTGCLGSEDGAARPPGVSESEKCSDPAQGGFEEP